MNLLAELRRRFQEPLAQWVDNPTEFLGMLRPTQDPKFGDYQANFAMPLKAKLGRPPTEIAQELVAKSQLDDLCERVEVAGPGFINLTIRSEKLQEGLAAALRDPRLNVQPTSNPRTIVIDFSSPNVAKPMHVGHIRSTVIGDALAHVARFLGHRVITDNHLGDWGTQFGMIIYGYKHFRNDDEYQASPIDHLSKLYRLVRQLCDFFDAKNDLPKHIHSVKQQQSQLAALQAQAEPADKNERKQHAKDIQRLQTKIQESQESIEGLTGKIRKVEEDPQLLLMSTRHTAINQQVLEETAKLHAGDAENLTLWNEFLPSCMADIQRIYDRLDIRFDHVLGESFYHDRLQGVVDDFRNKGLSELSEKAVCVFLDGFEAPMLIQKSDGAYLYATTDLATIQYRAQTWKPDLVLYVVDHRQHEHFEKLFAAARKWGYNDVDLRHVAFGTVLGEDGRPFKTRAGDTVGLEGLLDEAEHRAREVLLKLQKEGDDVLPTDEVNRIAKIVGLGGLKFADLSQNRSSDYTFSYNKMLELKGYTATYLQYLYARVQGIYRKVQIDPQAFRPHPGPFELNHPLERALAMTLLRFEETLSDVMVDFRPNLLAQYLFDLTQLFFKFYDQCSVLFAESEASKRSRLQLCDLTARTIKTGLSLLGIGVVDQM